MLHTTNPVIKHKAGLLNLAEELSNVSKACKIMQCRSVKDRLPLLKLRHYNGFHNREPFSYATSQ